MIGRPYVSLSNDAIAYAWHQLAQRIGIRLSREGKNFSAFGVPLLYCQPECLSPHRPCIVVVPCSEDAWQQLLHRPPDSLRWTLANEALPPDEEGRLDDSIPALFWGKGYEDSTKPFVKRLEDGSVVFYADIIAATLFMLTRWEESISHVRDQHGRFPATASIAYKQRFLDRPLIDEYALVLQAWLRSLSSFYNPQPPHFSVKISHDIDFVRISTFRHLAADVFKRHDLHQAVQTFQGWIGGVNHDLALRGCYELAHLSERYGFSSAFYFMAADRSRFDSGYDPRTNPVQHLINNLRQRGHEVGFHPGYHTLGNPERFLKEKRRMDIALGEMRYGGRQHYLRFQVPDTWHIWEEARLTYDSTLGYADHEGFRCGTCHPFQPFDIQTGRVLDLWEAPLIVMDGTLRNYRNLTPDQGEERILLLAQRCRAVNGVFTLLWHNTSLYGEWSSWATMYRRVLPQLAAL